MPWVFLKSYIFFKFAFYFQEIIYHLTLILNLKTLKIYPASDFYKYF